MPIRASLSTVTVAAGSTDLVYLATVKDELAIADKASDARLKRWIGQASAAAANYCNRTFVVETLTDRVWPLRDGWPCLVPGGIDPFQLSRWPVVSVTSVDEDGAPLVDGTDYRLDGARGQLIRLDASGYPRRWPPVSLTVEYSAGYATIPADVADAVIRLVKGRWFMVGQDPRLRSESIPGVRDVSYWIATGDEAGAMTPDVVDLLDNYRMPVVA